MLYRNSRAEVTNTTTRLEKEYQQHLHQKKDQEEEEEEDHYQHQHWYTKNSTHMYGPYVNELIIANSNTREQLAKCSIGAGAGGDGGGSANLTNSF